MWKTQNWWFRSAIAPHWALISEYIFNMKNQNRLNDFRPNFALLIVLRYLNTQCPKLFLSYCRHISSFRSRFERNISLVRQVAYFENNALNFAAKRSEHMEPLRRTTNRSIGIQISHKHELIVPRSLTMANAERGTKIQKFVCYWIVSSTSHAQRHFRRFMKVTEIPNTHPALFYWITDGARTTAPCRTHDKPPAKAE